jgi:hypothetical protein
LIRREHQRQVGQRIRILVSFEDGYRSYREVIAATIRIMRPRAEVATSDLDTLGNELARFNPHLVICSCPKPSSSDGVAAWVELSLDVTGPGRICIGGHYSERRNPTLETLLEVIDEVERLMQTAKDFGKC